MRCRCPHCHHPIEIVADDPLTDMECPSCGSHFHLISGQSTTDNEPRRIAHFELISQVGTGKFGSVWKARDTKLDRIVAAKIPRLEDLTDTQKEQFFREARSAAQVKHPHIVSVHEVGRDGDTVFIVSDFVDGANLKEYTTGQQLTFRDSAELCHTIADAVQAAHEAGVIHRDLKPQNILMDAEGKPYVADFGLAKRDAGEITMTVDGAILGTPAYMPPEQASGRAHDVDCRADVYSLGVILYELLTGELPFRGQRQMMLLQIQRDEPTRPTRLNHRIPRDLDTICLKCMEKEVARRYGSAKEVAEELERFLGGLPIHARPLSSATRTWRWCRRNPLVSTLLALLMLSLILGTTISTYYAIAFRFALNREQVASTAAKERRLEAERQARIANARRLAAQSMGALESSPQRSLLLANEAVKTTSDYGEPHEASAEQALRAALDNIGGRPIDGQIEYYYRGSPRISPNGKWLATASTNGSLRLFDLDTAEPVSNSIELEGHEGKIASLVFSPDSRLLAASTAEGGRTVCLWDLSMKAREAVVLLSGHRGAINSLAISPDGRWLATASDDRTSRVWDLRTIAPAATKVLSGHQQSVTYARFTADGRWLVTASLDLKLRLWAVGDAGPSHTAIELKGHKDWISAVDVSSNGKWVVSASKDNTARLWNVLDLDTSPEILTGHTDVITSARFSPDSRWLVTASANDGTARLWSLTDGELVRDPKVMPRFYIHRHFGVAFSSDSKWMSATSADGLVRLVELNAKTGVRTSELHGHESGVSAVAFSPDDHWLATGGWDNAVRLWDLTTDDPSRDAIVLRGHDAFVWTTLFSPDSDWLVTVDSDNRARLWDLKADEIGHEYGDPKYEVPSHADPVMLGFTPDNRWLLTGRMTTLRMENIVDLWNLQDRAADPISISANGRTVLPTAISSDGKWLATADSSGTVHIWDLRANNPKDSGILLGSHGGEVTSTIFSLNGNWLATGSIDHSIRVWDLSARDPARNFVELSLDGAVRSIAFDVEKRRLAAGSATGTTYVWQCEQTVRLDTLLRFSDHQHAAAVNLSPDGRWLLTQSDGLDEASVLRDLQAQNPEKAVHLLEDYLAYAAFTPDSHWLISSVGVWNLESDNGAAAKLGDADIQNVSVDAFLGGGRGRWIITRTADLIDFTSGEKKVNRSRAGIPRTDLPDFGPMLISSDARWTVTSSPNMRPLLWDMSSNAVHKLAVELPHNQFLGDETSILFSQDNRFLATGGEGTLRVWDLDLTALLRRARIAAGRELTPTERTQYLVTIKE